MTIQITIDFDSHSPINRKRLSGQNQRLFNYLNEGNSITIYSPAMKELGIGYLNSRISDLIHRQGILIHSRMVEINGNHVKEYSMRKFKN